MRSTYGLDAGADVDWLTRAACRGYDPEWWTVAHPADTAGRMGNRRAARICRHCPVQVECVDLARRLGSDGLIIAGRSISQRQRRAYAELRRGDE